MPSYSYDYDYAYVVPAIPIVPAPVVIERAPRDRHEKVVKSRDEAFKDAKEMIANNRQKYEPEILELEGRLDNLMHFFDSRKNDPQDQSNKRKAICWVDSAKEKRQHWVNKLDDMWEKYEMTYKPLTSGELAVFEAAVTRAVAPMEVDNRGISLLGGQHETRCTNEPSRRESGRHLAPPPATHRAIAPAAFQSPEYSTAVVSRFTQRPESSTSRASSARNSTARPNGARVAETGSFSRKSSRLGEPAPAPVPSPANMSTHATSRHNTSARGYQSPGTLRSGEGSRSSSRSGTARPEPNGRNDLLRQATTASSRKPTTGPESSMTNSHVGPRSSRR